ncbi:hypothetical protein B0H34DRAFT_193957 [Crassisporium funariophilum]|nr:hypothetical protein B0H34DRAFT_193957 [Crassisporium funariophilum]
MQTSNTVRGYSDFFASGFRAVTNRTRRQSRNSLSGSDPIPHVSSSFSTTRPTVAGMPQRRPRPVSMIVQNTTPSKPREKVNGRRSSFISFSSRLFDRMTSSTYENSTSSSSTRSSRSSRMFDSADENIPEVWITAGGPYTPSAPNGSPEHSTLHRSIDPFASSPDARSLFIDLSSDSSPSGTPKRESFLSLTGSSNRSSLIVSRRERPTSIQTMPLPSQSRRSSFQYRPPSQEKPDFFWIVEEEPNLTSEPLPEHEEWDAPAKIDWRQFHVDILIDDAQ